MEGFKTMPEIFDHWPEKYDQWFETPVGKLVQGYERQLILRMLKPDQGEFIPDAGCGTGVFTSALVETAVHFQKTDPLDDAQRIEREGRERGLKTGAFVAACWIKLR